MIQRVSTLRKCISFNLNWTVLIRIPNWYLFICKVKPECLRTLIGIFMQTIDCSWLQKIWKWIKYRELVKIVIAYKNESNVSNCSKNVNDKKGSYSHLFDLMNIPNVSIFWSFLSFSNGKLKVTPWKVLEKLFQSGFMMYQK